MFSLLHCGCSSIIWVHPASGQKSYLISRALILASVCCSHLWAIKPPPNQVWRAFFIQSTSVFAKTQKNVQHSFSNKPGDIADLICPMESTHSGEYHACLWKTHSRWESYECSWYKHPVSNLCLRWPERKKNRKGGNVSVPCWISLKWRKCEDIEMYFPFFFFPVWAFGLFELL